MPTDPNAHLTKATQDQNKILAKIHAILTTMNDNFVAVHGRDNSEPITTELEVAEFPTVVTQVPVRFAGIDTPVGIAKVMADETIQLEMQGHDLTTIVTNLVSLNQIVGFELNLTYSSAQKA